MAWDNIKEKKPIPAKSIDGYVRTPAEEAQLNKTFEKSKVGNPW